MISQAARLLRLSRFPEKKISVVIYVKRENSLNTLGWREVQ